MGSRLRSRPILVAWRPCWVMVLALWALAGCGSASGPAPDTGIPRRLLLEARPVGRGARFLPPVTGSVVGACRTGLGARFGVHVELFAEDRVVIVPAGIGTEPPRRAAAGRILSARCYGALVTLDPTGVVLVRRVARLSLSDLFRAWGQPLSRRGLASFTASGRAGVSVFVNGRRWPGAPGSVPLARHAEIVLEVGPHVPPHSSFTFPPGS